MRIDGNNNANRIVAANTALATELVEVFGFGGNDHITAPSINPSRIWGGPDNDTIVGSTGRIQADGHYGDDLLDCSMSTNAVMIGGVGNDYLIGGNGFNMLTGSEGNDTMQGGRGTDMYEVDSVGDVIIETYQPSAGAFNPRDSVRSTVSYVLGSTLEDLTLAGTGNINGQGNAGANVLTGNWYNNTLDGAAGNDTLSGEVGADLLRGGAGRDLLRGGDGRDTFDFNAVEESGPTFATRDVIRDFTRGVDRIDLSGVDARAATSGTNEAFRFVGSAAFSGDATGQVRYVYDAAARTGTIFISTDADSAAEMSIQVNGVARLSAADFVL
jgi:Ca2+-binding RTX toxin-like protein